MRKTIGIVFFVVAFAMAFRLVGTFMVPSVETRLEKVVAILNKKCPMVEDTLIRVDKTSVGDGLTLVYHCTALAPPEEGSAAQWLEETRQTVTSRIRASEDMQLLLKAGISLKYVYRAENGATAGELTVSPADLGVEPEQ